MFSTGYQLWWLHGLTHDTRDTTAVPSHARPCELPGGEADRVRCPVSCGGAVALDVLVDLLAGLASERRAFEPCHVYYWSRHPLGDV
jgi:hypothetical protein